MVDQVLKVVVKRGWEKDGRDSGCGQFLRTWALRTRDHGGYGHTITCKIAKCFEPSGTEGAEGLFLKNSSVKGISVVNEVLEMFEG